MTDQPDRPLTLELAIRGEGAVILEGLDALLRLNLITEDQVLYFCHKHFTCAVPEAVPVVEVAPQYQPPRMGVAATAALEPNPTPVTTRLLADRLQALMAEISVLWLLLLGVFLVVVSSAVLAASQWKNFPPAGQYGILFAYTLTFLGIALWAGRRPNLQLTAQMLQVTTLLIIPVNFWMMDGFKLWNSSLGWAIGAVSTLCLTGVMAFLLRSQPGMPRLTLLNSISLSWLHWGWSVPGFPLLATYLGTIGTAATTFYQVGNPSQDENNEEYASPLPLGLISVAFSTLLLVGRALLVAQIPLSQLGLALGICGWLLGWLARNQPRRQLWGWAGTGLMLAGWAVSVGESVPWQAIGVSSLGLWLLFDRLRHTWQPIFLSSFLLVGLQGYALLRQLIPLERRQFVIQFLTQQWGEAGMPEALIGIAAFPYILLMLGVALWLRRQDQPRLVRQTEWLALLLGGLFTLVSVFNPATLAINLLASALTLAFVISRRPAPDSTLVYLTHGVGLAAIAAWIHWLFPELSVIVWVALLLGGMAIEWGIAAIGRWTVWRQSAWHFGLTLSALSYVILFEQWGSDWSALWLAVPIGLTLLTYRPTFVPRTEAAWFSSFTLIALQVLTIPPGPGLRILGFGAATLLMLLNTRYLHNLLATVLTIGFGLLLSGYIVGEMLSDRNALTLATFLFLLSGFVSVLWLCRMGLRYRETSLSRLYQLALDGWAILLSAVTLQLGTIYALFLYFDVATTASLELSPLTAIGIVTGAIALRTLSQPHNLGFFGWAWGVETCLLLGNAMIGMSVEHLALANLVLGCLCGLAGDWWVSRSPDRTYYSSWHVIPLLYAGLGFALQHSTFTANSGLFTLGFALVGVGIGRRTNLQFLSTLSLLGFTLGAYEILIYYLLQAEGGSPGDGITLMATLAAVIAIFYASVWRWLAPWLRFSGREVQAIGHLHWAFSTVLLILALSDPLSRTGGYLWAGMMASVAGYALLQGRNPQQLSQETWTYAGIAELFTAIAAILYLTVFDQALLIQWSGAATSFLAYLMYTLPWQRWGWPLSPWRRSALGLPLLVTLAFLLQVNILSLLLVATYYTVIARLSNRIRLSYLGVVIADYTFFKLLNLYELTNPLWSSAIVGGSLLFIAQVDPHLQTQSAREQRHWLRCLATGLIACAALYQSDQLNLTPSSLFLNVGTLVLAIGLGLAGLSLRIRAFLYLGTALFMLKILRLLWLFVSIYFLQFWVIGIVLGAILMLAAASFEARRSHVTAFVRYWGSELAQWE